MITRSSNRREFLNQTEIEILRAKRSGLPLSLVMLDLDFFKSINDVHGHLAGDFVLKSVVTIASAQIRPTDTIGRMGGEEFAVLLPGIGKAEAAVIAERLRLRLEETKIEFEGALLTVTASLGVAEWMTEATDQKDWFAKADERLYKAKQSGRNRVVSS